MNKTERESLAIAIARVTARRPLPWRFLGDTPHSVFAARGESVAELDAKAPVEKLLVDCVNAVPKLLEALAAAEARIVSLEPPPVIKPWIAASEDSEFARQLTEQPYRLLRDARDPAIQPQCSFRDAQGLRCQAGEGHEPASMHLFVTTTLSGEPPSSHTRVELSSGDKGRAE